MRLSALVSVERSLYFQRLYATLEVRPASAGGVHYNSDPQADADRDRHNKKLGVHPMKLATLNALKPSSTAAAATPMLADYDGKEVSIYEVRIDASAKRPRGFVTVGGNNIVKQEVGASVILCKMLQGRFAALAEWAKSATPEQLVENGVTLFVPKMDGDKPVMNGKDPVMVENPDALVLEGTVKKLDRGVTLE